MTLLLEEAGLTVRRPYRYLERPLHLFMSTFSKRQTQERVRLVLRQFTAPLSLHHYCVSVWTPIAGQMFEALPDYSPEMIDVISRSPGGFVPVTELASAPVGAIVVVGVADRPSPSKPPRIDPTRTAVGWLGLPYLPGRRQRAEQPTIERRPHIWVDEAWQPCTTYP